MTISSTSTLAEIRGQYLDNAGYRTDGSLTKAKAYLEACRALLVAMPAESRQGSSSIRRELTHVQKEIDKAEAWIATHESQSAGGAGVKFKRFGNFRQ